MTKARVVIEGIIGIATIGGIVLLSPLLLSWYRRWGATEQEARRGLPGDSLVPRPRSQITCAVTIEAPIDQVWSWLLQLGCQRAGWYSYDLLDNGGVPSADRILPEHQHLAVGDKVLLTPDGRMGFPVAALDPGKAMVLGGMLNTRTGEGVNPGDPMPEAYYSGINVFVFDVVDETTTRLIFRQRLDWNPSFANTLIYRVFLEPISFAMGRKMLKGIKQRAEALAR
jgi:hypothetical protein